MIVIFLSLVVTMAKPAKAPGGSIALENTFPDDEAKYTSVSYFLDQITQVNTNTTVSISIDGEPPVPMIYEGIRTEKILGDSETRDWHTWRLTIPAITATGEHTFQFYRHYYVWQTADQYWAEYNASSSVHKFEIVSSEAEVSQPEYSSTPVIIAAVAVLAAVLIALTFAYVLPKRHKTQGILSPDIS